MTGEPQDTDVPARRRGAKRGLVVRGIVVILSVAALVALFRESHIGFGPEELELWVEREILGHGATGILVFIAVGAAFTGIGLSRQVLAFVAGYAFGIAAGTALALAGEIGGVLLAFLYARFLGRSFVAHRFPRRIKQVDDFLQVNPFLMTLAIRLLPVSNNLAVNLLAGVTSVRVVPFVAASAVGHLPQTVVFAMIGSGLSDGLMIKSGLAVALFAISVWIGVYLYREYRRGRVFDPAIDDAFEVAGEESSDEPRSQRSQ
jgi:uncharacterized membrane protein YdjX (TVP38/TMEM64 family)